ncbi:helix-turn-helix domain-containing protein [Sphingomonas phyllosphaerae]|uniref:helix-turn-helix domain-containing protein n=1 Tax=Sphingomonas phyllosphaerae TaxID=257003 RepID=UPI0009DB9C6B|nr:helix-turn-helix domain-containing protein [Sphingomonas phyllosphaerae]
MANDQHLLSRPLAVSIADAATVLQRDRATIYRMIKKGELRPVRYGGRQSIPFDQLIQLTTPVGT